MNLRNPLQRLSSVIGWPVTRWLSIALRAAIVVPLVIAIFIYFFGNYRILHADVVNITDYADEAPKSITLPYSDNSAYSKGNVPDGKAKNYRFTVHTLGYPGQRLTWHVKPMGCITEVKVDGKKVEDIQPSNSKLLCNSHGFILDLSKYATTGYTEVELTLEDKSGGIYGLNLRPVFPLFTKYTPANPDMSLYIAMWLFGALLFQLRFGYAITLIGAFSVYMYIADFVNIPMTKYAPDWWGHIPYIKYIYEHWLPPPSGQGWETYHPPLYYYLAAIAGKITMLWNHPPLFGARLVSFLSLLGFNVYAMLLLREIIKRHWLMVVASCAIIFWPLQHILVGRVTNEIFSYTLWAAAYYYMLLWYKHKQPKYLIATMVSCGIMMLIKVSAIVPIGTAGVLILLELWREQNKLRDFFARPVFLSILFMVLCGLLAFGRTYYYKTNHNPHMGYITSNLYKDPFYDMIRSKATLENMTYIDVDDIRFHPFVGVLGHRPQRELFWNTYIKTVHFGFYNFPRGRMATQLNTMLLILFTTALAAIPLVWRYDATHRFLSISLIIGVLAQMTNRIVTRTIPSNDGRLTFPIIILLVGWIAYVAESQLNRKRYLTGNIAAFIITAYTLLAFRYSLYFTNIYRFLPTYFW